jgi:integrase
MPHKRQGTRIWQIRVNGERQSSGTTDWSAADALEKKLNAEAWQAEKFGAAPTYAFPQLCAKWREERGNKVSFRDDERIMEWWSARFSTVTDVSKISREMVDRVIQRDRPGVDIREATPANNTANHYVAILAAMLNAAAREWKWIPTPPVLRLYPKTEGREMSLTVEQWFKLRAELPDHVRRPAQFALATGMREGKLYGLKRALIDMKARKVAWKGTSNKLGNVIPINDTGMEVLEEIYRQPFISDDLWTYQRCVLKGDTKTFVTTPLGCHGKSWYKALKRAGLGDWIMNEATGVMEWQGFCWHGLRHTFATWLDSAGVPSEVIDRLGGWKGPKATRKTYIHTNVEPLRPYAAVIDHILKAGEIVPVQLVPVGTTNIVTMGSR